MLQLALALDLQLLAAGADREQGAKIAEDMMLVCAWRVIPAPQLLSYGGVEDPGSSGSC